MQAPERLRVSVIGYSDEKHKLKELYQSNYELAEARAQNTKQMILVKYFRIKSCGLARNISGYAYHGRMNSRR